MHNCKSILGYKYIKKIKYLDGYQKTRVDKDENI